MRWSDKMRARRSARLPISRGIRSQRFRFARRNRGHAPLDPPQRAQTDPDRSRHRDRADRKHGRPGTGEIAPQHAHPFPARAFGQGRPAGRSPFHVDDGEDAPGFRSRPDRGEAGRGRRGEPQERLPAPRRAVRLHPLVGRLPQRGSPTLPGHTKKGAPCWKVQTRRPRHGRQQIRLGATLVQQFPAGLAFGRPSGRDLQSGPQHCRERRQHERKPCVKARPPDHGDRRQTTPRTVLIRSRPILPRISWIRTSSALPPGPSSQPWSRSSSVARETGCSPRSAIASSTVYPWLVRSSGRSANSPFGPSGRASAAPPPAGCPPPERTKVRPPGALRRTAGDRRPCGRTDPERGGAYRSLPAQRQTPSGGVAHPDGQTTGPRPMATVDPPLFASYGDQAIERSSDRAIERRAARCRSVGKPPHRTGTGWATSMRKLDGPANPSAGKDHAVVLAGNAGGLPFALCPALQTALGHPDRTFDLVIVCSEPVVLPSHLPVEEMRIVTAGGAGPSAHLTRKSARRSNAAYPCLMPPQPPPDCDRIAYLDCDIAVASPGTDEFLKPDLHGRALTRWRTSRSVERRPGARKSSRRRARPRCPTSSPESCSSTPRAGGQRTSESGAIREDRSRSCKQAWGVTTRA